MQRSRSGTLFSLWTYSILLSKINLASAYLVLVAKQNNPGFGNAMTLTQVARQRALRAWEANLVYSLSPW